MLKIEDFKIENIIPYSQNNRTHPESQIERIAKSISEFGFNQPIVIDESNIVLVGHGRLLAAQKLGLETVPVHKVNNLSKEQKRAYRILDNKLQNDSGWDFDNLGIELDLLEQNGFELEPWGLDELKNILVEQEEPQLSDSDNVTLDSNFRVEIICTSESQQKEVYERLTEEGLQCRLLTL